LRAVFLGAALFAAAAAPPPPHTDFRSRALEWVGPREEAGGRTVIWFGPGREAQGLRARFRWAADQALEEVRKRKPAAAAIRLLRGCWSENPWGTGVAKLFRAVYAERALAVLGGVDGPSAHLAEQVVAKARLPLVSPAGGDASITLAGVPWMFACAPSGDATARFLIRRMQARLGVELEGLVVFAGVDHDARAFDRELMRRLETLKAAPMFRFEVPEQGLDMGPILAALSRAPRPPAAFLLNTPPGTAALLIPPLRKAFPHALLFGAPQLETLPLEGEPPKQAVGLCVPALAEAEPSPERERLARRFRAVFRKPPDDALWLAYDAAKLLFEAIAESPPERAALRETLFRMSPWRGLAGEIRWDGLGRNTRAPSRMRRLEPDMRWKLLP